jgi:hypothetical protein
MGRSAPKGYGDHYDSNITTTTNNNNYNNTNKTTTTTSYEGPRS